LLAFEYTPTPEEAGGWPFGVLLSEYWQQKALLDRERRAAARLVGLTDGLFEAIEANQDSDFVLPKI